MRGFFSVALVRSRSARRDQSDDKVGEPVASTNTIAEPRLVVKRIEGVHRANAAGRLRRCCERKHSPDGFAHNCHVPKVERLEKAHAAASHVRLIEWGGGIDRRTAVPGKVYRIDGVLCGEERR